MNTTRSDDRGGIADDSTGFGGLGLRPELVDTLTALGYEEPTPIQRETIPLLIEGADLLGQAATGTGKTAAFALPILQLLDPDPDARRRGPDHAPRALVLVPTRELAMQVCEAMYKYGKSMQARVVPVYGGQPIYRQIQALQRGVDVVVATPGRALDHLRRGSISLESLRQVVLDEADEMLDMGFAEDIEEILGAAPASRQTVLFSATMPPRISGIAKAHLTNPRTIRIERSTAAASSAAVTHTAYVVARPHKAVALGRILDVEAPGAAIVFCRTRVEVDQLTETLNGRGYRAEALHGGMDQEHRDRVMGRMRAGTAELLIATDVAARGLDLDTLTHVVNFDVPSSPEVYVHRVGRVGRAGRSGVAITLAEPRERRLLGNIERIARLTIDTGTVPSVAELRARQHQLTAQALRTELEAGAESADTDGDPDSRTAGFADVIADLQADYTVAEIAAAAIGLYHRAAGNVSDEIEIPSADRDRRDRERRNAGDWGDRPERGGRGDRWSRDDRGDRGDKPRYSDRHVRPDGAGQDRAKIFVGLGHDANISPSDLVGAIANETSLSGRQIGPIKIGQTFSTVGVPPEAVDEVLDALSNTVIRGRRANVRRYVEHRQQRFDRTEDRPPRRGGFKRGRS